MKGRLIKELCLTFFLLMVMLLPGVIIDLIYFMRSENAYAGYIVANLYSHLKPYGITYTTAFNIMSNNVGVLLAMVSLFFTMNINIVQRSEKKVLGIPYREVEDINQNELYKLTKRISYFSPILMLFVLNLRLCVTGYLLFCYCYGFLIMHYYFHASSFSMEWARKKVAKRLVNCLPRDKEWSQDELREYDMFLEGVGRGIEEEGNWKEAESLYDMLDKLSGSYASEQRQMILSHFYKIVYWDRKEKNISAIFRLWNLSMENKDIILAKTKQINEYNWVFLWAMLKIILKEAEEKELLLFFEDFLQFKLRSKKTLKSVGEELPNRVLCEQAGIVIVLLEYRLREKLIEQKDIVWYIRKLVDFGDKVFLFQDYNIMHTVEFLSVNEKDAKVFLNIVSDLAMDFKTRSKRCVISNIVMD